MIKGNESDIAIVEYEVTNSVLLHCLGKFSELHMIAAWIAHICAIQISNCNEVWIKL